MICINFAIEHKFGRGVGSRGTMVVFVTEAREMHYEEKDSNIVRRRH